MPVTMTAEQLRTALTEQTPLPDRVVLAGDDALDLTGVALRDADLDHLTRVDIGAMRTLRLGPAGITAADLDRLCAIPGLAAIETLVLDCGSDMGDGADHFGDAGAARLAACSALRSLEVLRLPMCLIGDDGLAALAAADWPALTALDLHGNEIGPRGVEALVASPVIGRLDALDLTGSPIGDAGVAALVKSGVLGRAVVALGHSTITDAAAESILSAPSVRSLVLDRADFSDDATARLTARFGAHISLPGD